MHTTQSMMEGPADTMLKGKHLHEEASTNDVAEGDADHSTLRISVCIVCRNEAHLLQPCLDSVTWADEIVVLDLSSNDGSAELARGYGARVIVREPVPYAEEVLNEVIAVALGEWVLIVAPDERIMPKLAIELRRLAATVQADAIDIPRTNYYLGFAPYDKYQRYERHVRMFRQGTFTWPTAVHSNPVIPPSRVHYIPDYDELVIAHDTWRTIPEILDRFVRYVPAEARKMMAEGRCFSAWGMLIEVAHEADKHFFRGREWQNGVPGFLYASMFVAYRLFVWAAFWQLSSGCRDIADDRTIKQIGAAAQIIRSLASAGGYIYRLQAQALQYFRTLRFK
jgi:glycosyltransferase involved in cell wall biosynthesis